LFFSVLTGLLLALAATASFNIGKTPSADLIKAVLVFWGGFALALLAAITLHFRKKALFRIYNPNIEPVEQRLARGRELAVPFDDLKRWAENKITVERTKQKPPA
jgi:hypothetical protein